MLERFAPRGSSRRTAVLIAGAFVLLFVYTQVFLVGDNKPGRGVPMSIVFQGFLVGALNSMTAAGLILIYRANRIINFAQAVIGVFGLIFVLHMVAYNPGFPFPLTLLVGIAASAGLGAGIEVVLGRRFARAPRLTYTVMTITGAGLIFLIATTYVVQLPFFPALEERALTDLSPARIRSLLPFSGFDFHIGSTGAPFGFPEILALEFVAIAFIGLALFFRFTRAGTAVRAVAENPERAALLGIGVAGLSTLVWALAGVLSGMTFIADGLMGFPAGFGQGYIALLPPLAAAVLARMTSLPVAVAVSLVIGIGAAATNYTYANSAATISLVLFIALGAALLLQRRRLFRQEPEEDASWQAAQEPRPIPKELRSIPTLRWVRIGFIALFIGLAGIFPFITAVRIQNLFSVVALVTIAGLSLVVLTGWSGQVSLGQFAFVAVGAAVGGALSANANWPFWFAVPAATVVTGLVAGVVGLPALRIRGLYLAVATFAFAAAVSEIFASPRYLRDDLPRQVDRPTLFFLDFEEERSMYFLCVAALVLSVVVVVNLRRSRFGRLLIAARENEANVQSFGVSVVRLKLLAFVVSGALCGFAGGIYAFQQRSVNGLSFGLDRSFFLFTTTIVGGVSSPVGALLGSGYANLSTYFFQANELWGFLTQLTPVALLYVRPGGMISIVNQLRDSWLRIIAQRRQIVVPSLFADYDPDALERRLIPLSEPTATRDGGAAREFALESDLYKSGEPAAAPRAKRADVGEIATIAAGGEGRE